MAKATRRKRRPVTSISKEKKAELISFYQLALQDLVAALTSSQVLESRRPRLNALIRDTDRILRELDAKAAAWSRAEIERLYRGNISFVDGQIRGKGLTKEVISPEVSFAKVHVDAVQELITNPKTGLGPRLQAVSSKISTDIKGFAKSHKVLSKQLKAFNKQMAQGALQGASAATIRNQILESISGKRTSTWMGLQRFQGGIGPGGKLQTLANAPWLVKSNGAKMHIFDHVQMTVLTRESEIRNRARAARLIERGIELAQISPNPPLTPDACALYAGRIVALTPEAAEATGYPLIDRLPNGGPPFHPNALIQGTIVDGCNVESATSRYFRGKIVTIKTALGKKLTVTANHPVATERGFIYAKLLKVGDCVFRSLSGGGVTLAKDDQNGPVEVSQMLQFCKESRKFGTVLIPTRAHHFHDEGVEGEVAIVSIDSELLRKFVAERTQPTIQNGVVLTSRLADASVGSLDASRAGMHRSKSGSSPARRPGFASLPTVGSAGSSVSTLRDVTALEDVIKSADRDLSFETYVRDRYPGEIQVDRITSIRVRAYDGHVFCLQSSSGLYSADGLIVKNCTHTLRGWFGDLEDEEDQAIAEQVGPGGGKTVRGGIPESALDKSWSDVQKGVRKKGFSSTVKQNPQVARANIPTSAGDEVREAIDEARGTTKRKEAVKPPPPAPEKPSISRPTRQAEEPLTAPPKPSSAPPKYDDKELRALVVDPKSSIDFKRVPHQKDYRVASRTAQREMLDSGLLGPKTKSKKLLTKLGYLNETGFQVDDFIRDIMNPRLSAPTKAGISAGELRRQFTKATGLKRGDIFSRERVSDTLRKLNGPVSPLHKEIQANATKEFKKAKAQVGSVYGKASKQAKNVAETERSFAKFLETINVAVLSTKMARIKWRQFKRGRAHASSRKNEIKLTASNWDENGLAPTHAHEFGHHIEFRNEDILERTRSFVEDRARLTSWRIHNMSWAEKRGTLELGWDDSFFDPYVGRIYTKKKSQRSLNKNPVLAGKDLSWTEVVSMGVESLESQVYLKKLLTEDPEHFALIWAILRGY